MEVDVERLARAIHAATASSHYQALSSVTMFVCQVQAEAAMSDLTAQGFVVVRREELAAVLDAIDEPHLVGYKIVKESAKQLRAALTAAQEEEE